MDKCKFMGFSGLLTRKSTAPGWQQWGARLNEGVIQREALPAHFRPSPAAAPCSHFDSSTLKQHPAAACCSGTRSGTSMPARKHDCDSSTLKGVPSRQLESGRHSNSSTLKQHLVAAPCRGTTIPAPKRTHSDSRASKHIHHSDSRCTLQRHQHARSKFTVMVFETSQG